MAKQLVQLDNLTDLASAASESSAPVSVTQRLSDLHTSFFRTNKQLYLVLGSALCLAREIENDETLKRELHDACEAQSLSFHAETPTLNRVLRYIIGTQGRANNYAAALKYIPATYGTPEMIARLLSRIGIQQLRLTVKYGADSSAKPVGQFRTEQQAQADQKDDAAIETLMSSGNTTADIGLSPGSARADGQAQSDQQDEAGIQEQLKSAGEGTRSIRQGLMDDRAQCGQQYDTASPSLKSIKRSNVTADTLPKAAFVLIGPSAAADTLDYIDDPSIVSELLDLIRDHIKHRPVADNDAAHKRLLTSPSVVPPCP